jgi:hypothetical protein
MGPEEALMTSERRRGQVGPGMFRQGVLEKGVISRRLNRVTDPSDAKGGTGSAPPQVQPDVEWRPTLKA